MKITNNSDISLALAVWLLHDEYDYVEGVENYISATTLMKPVRQVILSKRLPPELQTADVEDYISRKMGTALHDSIEKAWVKGHAKSLRMMGYPDDLIEKIRVNPTDAELDKDPDILPIYLEQRMLRLHNGFTIGGKFDLVTEGIVQDNKSTSTYAWVKGSKDNDYRLQMSLYRWIDAKRMGGGKPVITEDYGRVNFIFTDWKKVDTRDPAYPQKRVEHKEFTLMSLEETEAWVSARLAQIAKAWNAPEHTLPDCTDEELWISPTVHKYYSDPAKTDGRATKNFDNLQEANAFLASKGGKGVVKTVRGEPKRCGYCDAFPICSQKSRYFL